MNALIAFSNALSDPVRLRLLSLLREHKADFGVLRETLGISEDELSRHVRLLIEAGLLKATKTGTQAKLKHKHAALLEKLFMHFKIGPKKQAQLGADRKKLHQIYEKKSSKPGGKIAGKNAGTKK
jgi:DNA-binding transcriptional ArsR family regulator